jgi:2-oxoglutarate ferredoxin oxidoreductase subunit beta
MSYTKDNFTHTNEVRWCPGCGDYAILSALQKTLPLLGLPPEKHVFVSGIGCSGRLPYYMNAYGFHTIHGRGFPVATAIKAMRPDLTVWLITGDGDGLSIGGHHLMHMLRRNPDVNVLLLNNQVYGLTKGQFSPTSPIGQCTKTSPIGVNTKPLTPLVMALAAGASFVARGVDKDPSHLSTLFQQAFHHKGTSFIEIYQDCHIFNEGAFDDFSAKMNRKKHTLMLEANKPMVFGEEDEKGIILKEGMLTISTEQSPPTQPHQPHQWHQAMQLAKWTYPEFPVPLGVFYEEQRPLFTLQAESTKSDDDLQALYRAKNSWTN